MGSRRRQKQREFTQLQMTEEYKILRTNIQFAGALRNSQVILFTSAQAKEGKTFSAANVAKVFAQMSKRVLLIDADMRKPSIHHVFHISNLTGLSTVLIDQSDLDKTIVASDIENLFILSSGQIPPNPSELLSSDRFHDVLSRLKSEFDLIIIDSPPVLSVTDALILSKVADGTIVVVNAQTTNRHVASKAVTSLRQVDANILGTVFNRVPLKEPNLYAYSTN